MPRPTRELIERIKSMKTYGDTPWVHEALLAEIDALEAENTKWKLNYDNEFDCANRLEKERDELKERVAKLREVSKELLDISDVGRVPTHAKFSLLHQVRLKMRDALAADDEMEKK